MVRSFPDSSRRSQHRTAQTLISPTHPRKKFNEVRDWRITVQANSYPIKSLERSPFSVSGLLRAKDRSADGARQTDKRNKEFKKNDTATSLKNAVFFCVGVIYF